MDFLFKICMYPVCISHFYSNIVILFIIILLYFYSNIVILFYYTSLLLWANYWQNTTLGRSLVLYFSTPNVLRKEPIDLYLTKCVIVTSTSASYSVQWHGSCPVSRR
jgi:hypothetical protein